MGRPSKKARKKARMEANRTGPYSAAFVCAFIVCVLKLDTKNVFVLYLQMTAAETETHKSKACNRILDTRFMDNYRVFRLYSCEKFIA